MIKFFRKIRQKMLTENKFSKYLLYSVGEIVLVVIGILIALSINNWNESKKDRVQEIKNFKNIQQDILLDTVDIMYNVKYHKLFQTSQKQLLNYLHSKDLQPKEIIKYELALGTPIFLTLHESSFTNLKDYNINIISNQELKKQISNHYDNISKVMLRVENDLEPYKTYIFLKPYFLKHFSNVNKVSKLGDTEFNNEDYYNAETTLNTLILTDTLGLKNNRAFKIDLAESIAYTGFKIDMYKHLLKAIYTLNDSINNELKKIE
ncbi:DUF6090 family protein [Lacinutrix sp. Bg11-31]|uniref:DUF6090 family protein n=1 Tax=Lacinutrix sp. Bg11-31 TaxID=2057808 RepID=UPI000C31AF3D|nr:DUF6090 family protein [Lacinutrix sp. Bg11-31]AUC80895.1 hypothetical protein CW733_01590 [Lacinutrix sp. Bg11-31]